MTERYKLNMDAWYSESRADRLGSSITDANRKFLSDEIVEYFRTKANKKVTIDLETDASYVQASIADYCADRRDTKKNCMETISEGEVLTIKDDIGTLISVNKKMSAEDSEQLKRFRRLLTEHGVGGSFRQRLIEIIIQYGDKATKKFKTGNASLTWDLWRLREEVQLHLYQRGLEKELTESVEASRKTSLPQAVVAEVKKWFRIFTMSI